VELGVLALYYRLSVEPVHQCLIQITGWVALTYTTIIVFVRPRRLPRPASTDPPQMSIFMCHPIPKAWDAVHYPDGCSIRLSDILTIQAMCNLVGSVAIFCMPLPVIHALNMPRRDKITITVMLLFGGIVVVASGLGLKWLVDFRRDNYDSTCVQTSPPTISPETPRLTSYVVAKGMQHPTMRSSSAICRSSRRVCSRCAS
jgi:hypothetical protein